MEAAKNIGQNYLRATMILKAGTNVVLAQLGSLTSNRRKNMIRPREITLAIILGEIGANAEYFWRTKLFFARSEVSDTS